jgi:hypothetical protein
MYTKEVIDPGSLTEGAHMKRTVYTWQISVYLLAEGRVDIGGLAVIQVYSSPACTVVSGHMLWCD